MIFFAVAAVRDVTHVVQRTQEPDIAMTESSPQPRYRRCPHLSTRQVDGDLLVFDNRTMTAIGMNRTCRAIWQLIEQPTTIPEIAGSLGSQFDMSDKRSLEDVEAVLNALVGKNLVEKLA